jgi:general secretion pathway protein H
MTYQKSHRGYITLAQMLVVMAIIAMIMSLISLIINIMMTYPNPHRGFTLIEIIVVMAIIAMMATLVIPRINSGSVTILQAQVRQAVAVLNYARRSAIVEGQAKTAYFYEGDQQTSNSPPIHWTSHGTALQWGNDKEKAGDNKKANEPDNNSTYQVTFYPEGGSSGGEILFSYQGHKFKVTVNPLTGKIESEYVDDKK